LILIEALGGTEKVCPQKDCNYSEVLEAPADA